MSTPDSLKPNWPLVLAPLAWAVQMAANYALEPVSCHQDTRMYFWLISTVALLLAAASAWKSWVSYRSVQHADPTDREARTEQFLGISGIGLGALSALVIFAQMMPTFFFVPCQ
jgi:hypothetical protein